MKYLTTILFMFFSFCASAQKEGNNWCFANGCGINWNDSTMPLNFTSSMSNFSYMPCATFSDQFGYLKYSIAGISFDVFGGRIWNGNGTLIQNGDSINCHPYSNNGALILPDPIDTNLFYCFSITRGWDTITTYPYVFKHRIDKQSNSVIEKNQLLTTEPVNQKIAAVRHANGRDWWLVVLPGLNINGYMLYLIDSFGVNLYSVQAIGDSTNARSGSLVFGQMSFSEDGTKLFLSGDYSNLFLMDFDRCTGQLSNFKSFGENVFVPNYSYLGCAISPDNSKFYAGTGERTEKKIWQFDLNAPNILASKTLIISYPDTGVAFNLGFGFMKLAVDGKIYIAKGGKYTNGNTPFTQSLAVIENPDSLGLSCNYNVDGLNLGGCFSILGLPNIPNYKLGPVIGSVCDSLGLGEKEISKNNHLTVYPNPSTGIFNFELKQKTDAIKEIAVYNSLGKKIFIGTSPQIDLSKEKAGLYYYRSTTVNGRVYKGKLQKLSEQ